MAFLESDEYNLTGSIKNISQMPVDGGGCSDIFKGELVKRARSGSWLSGLVGRRYSNPPEIVAIKYMRNTHHLSPREKERTRKLLNNEAEIWRNLEHPNVLPLLGYMYMEGSHLASLPSLISPWCEHGNIAKARTLVFNRLQESRRWLSSIQYILGASPRPADRISLILQALSAVYYLHSSRPPIVHGDLKPASLFHPTDLGLFTLKIGQDNFFIQSNYQVRLADFGLAKIPAGGGKTRFSNTGEGTSRFMSPEFFSAQNNMPMRSLPSDIWALGWTFYLLLTGLYPFPDVDFRKPSWTRLVADKIRRGDFPEIPTHTGTDELGQIQATVWPIMRECWKTSPRSRPRARRVVQTLREGILLRHSHYLSGPVFSFTTPEESRPSVIGNDDASVLEILGCKEPDPHRAREALAASALQYLCEGDLISARSVQIELGWKLLQRGHYPEAQAHLNVAQSNLDPRHPLIIRCHRGLARAALHYSRNPTRAIDYYKSALEVCRVQGDYLPYQEYILVREMVNAMFDNLQSDPEDTHNQAIQLFQEALSFLQAHGDLKYQSQVRCDLAQLELDRGNKKGAHAHALSAFQCALETGQRSLAESVFKYLLHTKILSEARLNSLDGQLHEMPDSTQMYNHTQTPECQSLDSSYSSWVGFSVT